MRTIESIFIGALERLNNQKIILLTFVFLWGGTTFILLKKYNFNPTAMINFGLEFVNQNTKEMPANSLVFLGEKDDLGAGYDGQIFYFYSRTISNLNTLWPKGFDESYRAPRIGYPFLISLFGGFGKWGNVFGMYFINWVLFLASFFALRNILSPAARKYSILYLISPFSLGSYTVLVSDSVMVSLIILSYYFFTKEKFILFSIFGGLAIITKEPALFFLFPLGLGSLKEKQWKKTFFILSTLLIPFFWQMYLRFTFPNWRISRITDFILPMEGIFSYLSNLVTAFSDFKGIKNLARELSRLPLFFLFILGVFSVFTGNIKKGWVFRLGIIFTLFMVGTAGYYHFWSVYENISRMFTIAVPLVILLQNEDESVNFTLFYLLLICILILFLVKILFIQDVKPFLIWENVSR
ncbi:MAG: hypothetical protein L6Q54_13050 [Leptospiraceae bacterium]|nr:hypothetical protein [Leptospiraceae bacterium]MCK6382161.1 hypothetical protein [Leptospiraceae bacterium]NUM41495.1 hypothetical protein [Leptospiraceae bacterium]